MEGLVQLTEYCRRLGAQPAQAEIMARQLLKRAEQIAVTRNQSREQALGYLLKLVAQGSAGQTPVEFQSSETPPGI